MLQIPVYIIYIINIGINTNVHRMQVGDLK